MFSYLRLSVTDICNFRCSYCLPNGFKKNSDTSFLSCDEILRLVRGFAELGVWKIRLTGGEPTLRDDFLDLAQGISKIQGVRKLAFTTNGYKLAENAEAYFAAGLKSINISVDSLKPHQFKEITGHSRLEEVLAGVSACQSAGFESIKLNTVLLKGINEGELDDFISFVADKNISIRFIELMRTRDNSDYFSKHHLSGTYVSERLLSLGWKQKIRKDGDGPAIEFEHSISRGRIGLISPYSKDFCKTCNRLRISSRGDLHLCLFGEGGYSLRHLLQNDGQIEDLQDKIITLMGQKKVSHLLHEGKYGIRKNLASIGG
jgi:cyclic pyranopterin phosphate synthase